MNNSAVKQIKICILSSAHTCSDIRVFHKEAKTLVRAGYTVVLIAGDSPEKKTLEGLKIISLPKPKNRFQRMTRTVCLLFKFALKEKADVYHFHDPELIPVGLMFKVLGKKVIYDAHEDVSKDILVKKWAGNITTRRIISILIRCLERFGCVFFDRIITVTPGIAEKFPARKTIVLRNFAVVEMIDKSNFAEQIHKRKPAIIYAGGLNENRGIKNIIRAMEIIKDKAELWLLGPWASEEFRLECESLPGWAYTRYFGVVTLEQMYNYMRQADIGIVAFLPRPYNVHCLPNKPFEYMACSLPVIMSSFESWQEVFDDCAVFCDSENPADIAEKINYVLSNPEKSKELANRGRERVFGEYNWENESKKLVQLYRGLFNG
jgi:glycosyltransferase involved in cell wall biosynthesis